VPGFFVKVIALLRGLPRSCADRWCRFRTQPTGFIPGARDRDEPGGRHGGFVTAECGTTVTPDTIAGVALPPWLRMNIEVVDTGARALRRGRDLLELRRALGAGNILPARDSPDAWQRSGVRRWDFGPIPPALTIASGGIRLRMYPTVLDEGGSVRLGLHPDAATAGALTRDGLVRLAALALPQQHDLVRCNAAGDRELALWLAAAGFGREVFDEARRPRGAVAVLDENPLPWMKPGSRRDWTPAAAGSRRQATRPSWWCAQWRAVS
jgi:ATP-dependent helicase HrpA